MLTLMGEIGEKYLLGGTFLLEIQNMYLKGSLEHEQVRKSL